MKKLVVRLLVTFGLLYGFVYAAHSNPKRIIIKKPQKTFVRTVVIDTGLNPIDQFVTSKLCKDHPYYDLTETGMQDEENHGSFVARLIAIHASGSPYCITMIKYYDGKSTSLLNSQRFLQGMVIAARLKADVVNISAGGPVYNGQEVSLIKYNPKIMWIVAAGNDNKNLDDKENKYYPASYALDRSIKNLKVVGALDSYHRKLDVSNWGNLIDFWKVGEYDEGKGTSFATPVAVGEYIHEVTHPSTVTTDE